MLNQNKYIRIYPSNLNEKKGEIMSISNITKEEKLEVLIRLLKSNESFDTACSKAGLHKSEAKNLLAQ